MLWERWRYRASIASRNHSVDAGLRFRLDTLSEDDALFYMNEVISCISYWGCGAMLISLHLPKTGGTSFRASLREMFGSRLLEDYCDLPLNTRPLRRKSHALIQCFALRHQRFPEFDCIHGHFLPLKYRLWQRGQVCYLDAESSRPTCLALSILEEEHTARFFARTVGQASARGLAARSILLCPRTEERL